VVEYPCGGKASVYKSPVYIWDRSQRAGSNMVGSWLEGGRASPQNRRALKSSSSSYHPSHIIHVYGADTQLYALE
jgi:hypothetical protein